MHSFWREIKEWKRLFSEDLFINVNLVKEKKKMFIFKVMNSEISNKGMNSSKFSSPREVNKYLEFEPSSAEMHGRIHQQEVCGCTSERYNTPSVI